MPVSAARLLCALASSASGVPIAISGETVSCLVGWASTTWSGSLTVAGRSMVAASGRARLALAAWPRTCASASRAAGRSLVSSML